MDQAHQHTLVGDEDLQAGNSDRQRVLCPAKVNLGLRVFPRREDGYHDIDSWFAPLSLADVLTVNEAPQPEIILNGMTADITTEFEKNLAGRAALAMGVMAGKPANVRIEIDKLIPTGGGLGGGSSDAAGAMLAISRLWHLDISLDVMAAEALQLGSDVPFFIRGQSARCRGRGERMTPLHRTTPLFGVLIVPPKGISTAEVYRIFDDLPAPANRAPAYDKIANAPACLIDDAIFNDLQPAAFTAAPWLKELHHTVERALCQRVHMSGSGSTLFTLHDRADQTEAADEILQKALGHSARILPVRVSGA
jgi:4-diphosphocytidyl-2-C-methyl-D-erythritol kinase